MKKGNKHSNETKKRLSDYWKGRPKPWLQGVKKKYPVWNKNKKTGPLSKEHKRKISEVGKGRVVSQSTREKLRQVNLGRKHSKEARIKMSKYWKGRPRPWQVGVPFTEERKKNISIGKRKNPTRYWLGKHHTFETKQKIANRLQGDKSNLWAGGLSSIPYTSNFNNILKEQIRHSWGNVCVLCGEVSNGRRLDIHHINYNKQDNRPENLIPLHASCHAITNQDRVFWIRYFGGCYG